MNQTDDKNVNPMSIKIAGSNIRKSVLYRVLTYISSLATLVFSILFLINQVLPAVIDGKSWDYRMDDTDTTKLILFLLFSILSIIFWILSLTTLNKAGWLLRECDNIDLDGGRVKIKQKKHYEFNRVAFFSLLMYFLIKLYFFASTIVYHMRLPDFYDFHFRYIDDSLILLLITIIGVYMTLKNNKWTFITGGVNILIEIYFFIQFVKQSIKYEEVSFSFKYLIIYLIVFTLLSVFIYTTLKYFKNPKSENQLHNE